MSENKKYFYLKLKDNFFDSDEMKLLESMPDGYKYSNILLKLYLRSLKNEGRLMLNNHIPYSEQMIAGVTGHSVGDVKAALSVFQDLGLIEKLDNGAIYMLDIQNFIGQSSTEADRIRKYRTKIQSEKQQIEAPKNKGVQMYDKRTPELEIELEKDIDIEKETNQQQQNDKSTEQKPSVGLSTKEYCNKIVDFYQFKCNFGQFTPIWYQDLDQDFADWLELNNDPEEVTNIFCLALKEAASVKNVRKPYQYAQGILDNWERNKHVTLSDIKAELVKKESGSSGKDRTYNYRKRSVVQKEQLPDWAGKEHEDQRASPEVKADLNKRMEELGLKK